jgi:hypothetical protein
MLGIVCITKLMKETMTMASIPTQEEVLAATRKSQEAMMAVLKTWLETVRTAPGKLPSVYAPLSDKLPKLPQVTLPFAGKLPTPQDAVANAYHLAEQLLASQRKFAEDLVKATAPLRPGYRESSPEVPSRSAWQDAVTDSEPKTPAVIAAPKAVTSTPPQAVTSTAPKAAVSMAPKAAVSTAPKAAVSTAPKAAVSAAPKAVTSTEPKAAPARSESVAKAPRTTAAKRTTTGSANTKATSARKSSTGTSTRKNAGPTTTAPKGTDAS